MALPKRGLLVLMFRTATVVVPWLPKVSGRSRMHDRSVNESQPRLVAYGEPSAPSPARYAQPLVVDCPARLT
jgi:hypothetical protein